LGNSRGKLKNGRDFLNTQVEHMHGKTVRYC
jgi:hypothetical protein